MGAAEGQMRRRAADRIATIPRTTSATTGLFYDVDGHETRYVSGEEGISTRIDALLRTSRAAGCRRLASTRQSLM